MTRRRRGLADADRSRILRGAALAVAVALSVYLSWTVLRPDGAPAGAPAPGAVDVVDHVHGIVASDRGDVLLGTHAGLWEVRDGRLRLVGESQQDVMGLGRRRDGALLGSGHPDVAGIRRGDPGRLGLMESADGGRTWQALSLRGDADLHLLSEVSGSIYAWDAGSATFMVAVDGGSWDRRSTVEISSFAVDPSSPERVVGALAPGLVSSGDGGRTWAPVEGPGAVLLAWDEQSGLWALDADGFVWLDEEGTGRWRKVDSVRGVPAAVAASAGELVVVSEEGKRLHLSSLRADGRRTETELRP